MHREKILNTALGLTCGDRAESYGEPAKNLSDIARLIDAYLLGKYNVQLFISAEDVAWFQVMTKAARTFKAAKEDNYIDAAAYAAIAGECRGPDPVNTAGIEGREDLLSTVRRGDL